MAAAPESASWPTATSPLVRVSVPILDHASALDDSHLMPSFGWRPGAGVPEARP
jgi:hypothetical protein